MPYDARPVVDVHEHTWGGDLCHCLIDSGDPQTAPSR